MSTDLNLWEYFVCGGVGGMLNVLVGHPLDTVKVRLQTSSKFQSTWLCLSHTVKNEGIFGLYRGMTAPLIGVTPIFALAFFGYGIGKKLFQADCAEVNVPRILASGAFSGAIATVAVTPFERIKCLLQVQSTGRNTIYTGPLDCMKKLYKQGGTTSIFRGLIATSIREIPANSLYFLTYTVLTKNLSNCGEPPPLPVALFSGGMAGVANWIIAMPGDNLKSRVQTAADGKYPGGIKQVFSELIQKDGLYALYRGFTPVMLRAFPANAACFLGFEVAAGLFRANRNKHSL